MICIIHRFRKWGRLDKRSRKLSLWSPWSHSTFLCGNASNFFCDFLPFPFHVPLVLLCLIWIVSLVVKSIRIVSLVVKSIRIVSLTLTSLLESVPSWSWSHGSWITTTYALRSYHHWCCEFESRLGWGVQHFVIKFVSDLRQVGGFLRVLRFSPPIKMTATI